jgi:hypothetical protein
MKERVLTGWNFSRVLFLLMGIAFIISSIIEFDGIGLTAGIYFSLMGIFALGCASGNCYGGQCTTDKN